MPLLSESVHACLEPLRFLRSDGGRVVDAVRARGARFPKASALADPSLWVVGLLRTAAALRRGLGTSLGLSTVLRLGFHIDVWTDDIGPGLRLPHPFNIVIGDGVEIGPGCTILHGVTVQRGAGTRIGRGAVLANGTTVLAGSTVGDGCLVGAASVVRGRIPAASVAVGAPARVVRASRPGEAAP
ncbi:acyltransferase [Corallococcus aberystwythensis]|nr:DapH/DapD/GlmU-related protein [Corallococcus aberystwythensis]